MSTEEEWRAVPGFPGYEVSSIGRVRSYRQSANGRLLKMRSDGHGYLQLTLLRDGEQHTKKVHRLVADAFHGPRPVGMETRHLDGDRQNNRSLNLKYGTASENQLDSVRHGTSSSARVTHCPQDHAYDAANTYITPLGKRDCRACRSEAAKRSRANRSAA